MENGGLLSVVGSNRSWREIAWLLVSFPLGLTVAVWAISVYSTAGSLVFIWVGLPMLAACQWTMRGMGAAERLVMNAVLRESIGGPDPVPDADARQPIAWLRWTMRYLGDTHAWRVVAWSFVRLVTAPVGFVLAVAALVAPVAAGGCFVLAILFVAGPLKVTTTHDATLDGSAYWWVVPASIVVALVLVPLLWWIVRGFTSVHRAFARWALGPCASSELAAATQRAQLAEERLRIDQELHDSIGHMITMNIVQAGAGAHVFDTDPDFARQALKNIEERGRAAMGELDRIIATLREDGPETRAPLPGIDDLAALVEQSRLAGMNVTAAIQPPSVSGAVGRAIFGIVRESLTNAARYAPGAPVTVTVMADADAVGVEVVNGAPTVARQPESRDGGGRGLAGIRDRAVLLGGKAMADAEGKGFAVRALLPLGTALEAVGPEASRWAALREKVAP